MNMPQDVQISHNLYFLIEYPSWLHHATHAFPFACGRGITFYLSATALEQALMALAVAAATERRQRPATTRRLGSSARSGTSSG
eukprot:6202590-Pleurochrysis_carterae.AAC.3